MEQRTALVRAFSSLTRRDVDAVRATLREAASDHALEEHDDYDGYLSMVLNAPDETQPSYLVAGRTNAIELAAVERDEMAVLGCFASIGAAMSVLRPLLEREVPAGAKLPPSVGTITSRAAEMIERHGDDAPVQAALLADRQEGWQPVLRAIDVLKKLPRTP